MANETGNRNRILEVQIPVLVSALDRPAFDRTQLCLLAGLSNALARQKFQPVKSPQLLKDVVVIKILVGRSPVTVGSMTMSKNIADVYTWGE